MFNIYIYDYCFKRGFRKTARELLAEAEIPQDSIPPINARQGLLFEWWSVFWVLFQAKSNTGGSEDGLLYTQVRGLDPILISLFLPCAISTATWYSNYSTAATAPPVPADGGCDGPARAIAATCSGDDERHPQ